MVSPDAGLPASSRPPMMVVEKSFKKTMVVERPTNQNVDLLYFFRLFSEQNITYSQF
jgi:hypothetical protein